MTTWTGKWTLTHARATYHDLKPAGQQCEFELELLPGAARTYRMVFAPGQMPPLWQGCELLERSGKDGPSLHPTLPHDYTENQGLDATKRVLITVQKLFTDDRKRFERLEGDVMVNGRPKAIAIFKVENALDGGPPDKRAMLVVIKQVDIDKAADPDGSLVGKRR